MNFADDIYRIVGRSRLGEMRKAGFSLILLSSLMGSQGLLQRFMPWDCKSVYTGEDTPESP